MGRILCAAGSAAELMRLSNAVSSPSTLRQRDAYVDNVITLVSTRAGPHHMLGRTKGGPCMLVRCQRADIHLLGS
eukprot:447481-Pelagomonas_calceolata.AAC.8